ncbi:MAG: DNA integrity scanning diadenylate cyclase DisA [Actinomycetota bacterium]
MKLQPPLPVDVLRRFAPGSTLRDAAELIFRQRTGVLLVLGSSSQIDDLCTGGFRLSDVPVTAQRIAELAKMDGGIVVDDSVNTITRANVHFIPDPRIPTDETGTRFRTADRLGSQTGLPVLAVSEEGRDLAVLYVGDQKFVLQSPTALFAEANQRLQSLERLRRRLDAAVERLSLYEVDDIVTMRDAVKVIQRAALVLRHVDELELIAIELGDEAPLVRLQASDVAEGVVDLVDLVNADYQSRKPRRGSTVVKRLDEISIEDLYHTARVGEALGLVPLDPEVSPRGVRALAAVPRIPNSVRDRLQKRFGTYRRLLTATVEELDEVEGVGPRRAARIRAYLDQGNGVLTPHLED